MKNKILIFHYHPLEQYPPVMNILNSLNRQIDGRGEIWVFTNCSTRDSFQFGEDLNNIQIFRGKSANLKHGMLRRVYEAIRFVVYSLSKIIFNESKAILYFDTISSPIPWVIKRFLKPETKLFIHFHEYMTREEYRRSGFFYNLSYKLEQQLYASAKWISHTNQERLNKFCEDNKLRSNAVRVMANYPPINWYKKSRKDRANRYPLRFIYIGALGFEELYLKEFSDWVEFQNGTVRWDIYSLQETGEFQIYLKEIKSRYISIKGAVSYFELPEILSNYDIGVILYKGANDNFIYNAPNKLFEYLSIGLDVWFPKEMIGCMQYESMHSIPKVISVDFTSMSKFDLKVMISRDGLPAKKIGYNAEEETKELCSELLSGFSKKQLKI